MIGVIARPDDGLHPRSPGSFAQRIRRWNQLCLNSRDKHPKFNQKQQKKSRRRKKNNISSNQQKNISNLPTFPRTKKINISEEKKKRNPQRHQKNNNKQTKRIIGLVASSFILLFLYWNTTLSKTTTKNRDLESFLSQLFSQFSSLKLRKCRPEWGWTFLCRAVNLSLPSRYNNNNENTITNNNNRN